MRSKKEDEKRILKILVENEEELSEFKLEKDNESPDFILVKDKLKIGIEVTRIINKSLGLKNNPQALSSYANKVKDGLKKLLDKNEIGPLHVTLHLSMMPRMLKVNRNDLILKLYFLILQNLPSEGKYKGIRNDFNDLYNFPEVVSAINMLKLKKMKKNFVTVPLFGWVQEDFTELLQNEIIRKEKKIKLYQNKVKNIWLGIYADWESEGSMFEATDATIKKVYKSKFERVYFINAMDGKVNKLLTKK